MSFNFGAALAVFMAGASPTTDGTTLTPAVYQSVPVIAPAALKPLLASGKVFLIDVREPDEFAAGHIAGARLIPLASLEQAYRGLPRDVKLVVYCRSGKRSPKAVSFLIAQGYSNAVSLAGGYLAWSAQRD